MKRHAACALLLCLILASPLLAQYQPELSNRSPYIDGYMRRHGTGGATSNRETGTRRYDGFYPGYTYYPRYGSNYYGYPYFDYYLDTSSGVLGPYQYPPLFNTPAGLIGPQFAPLAAPALPPRPLQRPLADRAPQQPVPEEAEPQEPKIRLSNPEARARARRFQQIGDENFRDQRFHNASQRYRQAQESAPDLSEPYFHQGLALVAMSRYDAAVTAIRRGLELDDQWPRGDFRLDYLYAGANISKTAHQEALAQAATARPDDPALLYLLGVLLYFDGKPERALPFFQRAAAMNPNDQNHIQPFLNVLAPEPEAAGDPAGVDA